jgi:hypothetical protein
VLTNAPCYSWPVWEYTYQLITPSPHSIRTRFGREGM